ncbi:hypothetical protein HanRHA438_Chr04g0173361 [Helianthus annuus]|nr:hypothetical protein HanRHA438_Chr04g0173361 [Helianthus annuus]
MNPGRDRQPTVGWQIFRSITFIWFMSADLDSLVETQMVVLFFKSSLGT